MTVGFLTLKELAKPKNYKKKIYICHSLYCSLVHELQAITDPLLADQTKSQMNFCHQLHSASVVNFFHFNLRLINHWANMNQTLNFHWVVPILNCI